MLGRGGTDDRREQLYREAIGLIESEYGSDLTLEGVARRIATSVRQLQRVFAEVGGTSFRDQLARVRMEAARELLETTSIAVRDVAAEVGYRQPTQFAKAFKRYHGFVPSACRQARDERGFQPAALS